MTGAERVILALASLQKSGDAVFLTELLHLTRSAGEKLVRIALMSDVPQDLVSRRVEHRMQSNGELDDAEPGADVPPGPRADLDEALAHVRAELLQLIPGERLEITGGVYGVKNRHYDYR